MKVYNRNALTRNQRFNNALLYGILATLGVSLTYGLFFHYMPMPFIFSATYIAIGYIIGYVIQVKGRGVQQRFSILAVVLTIIAFILGDLIKNVGLVVFTNPLLFVLSFKAYLSNLTAIPLIFRAIGVYYAYINARVVS